MNKITDLFNTPKIIGVVADANEGKSNLVYHMVEELSKRYRFNIYAYGLRSNPPNVNQVFSVQEVEQIKNSLIILEEFSTLFDLDNRKIKRQIENTIRLIFHNNNVLVLSGLSENYKKFISAKLDYIIFKKLILADLINGSRVKEVVFNYNGVEKGSSILNLNKDEAIVFDGLHYTKLTIPYLQKYDLKKDNVPIFVQKNEK